MTRRSHDEPAGPSTACHAHTMDETEPDRAGGQRQHMRRAAAAGMVAPVVFVAVFTVEGALRAGYDPVSMFVSELSLGPRGWVQIVNFLVTGALVVVFGRACARVLERGPAATAGPVLLQIIGVSLMVSGPFVTDPSALFDQHSVHGLIHGILGAVVFSVAPVACFVFYRRFRTDPAWPGMAGWTLTAGIGLVVAAGVLKVAQQPDGELFTWKGLIQRVFLIGFMAWLFTVAARMRSRVRS